MGILDNHPYTAVTAITNRIIDNSSTSSDDGLIEIELAELFEAIRLQKNYSEPGPVEAARAIRKRLKHGTFNQQFNALKLMELLIANGGPNINVLCQDHRLLDYFKYTIGSSDSAVDPRIKQRMVEMTIGWRNEYKNDDQKRALASLYNSKGVVRKTKKAPARVVPDFMNDEADDTTPFEEVYEDLREMNHSQLSSSSSSSRSTSTSKHRSNRHSRNDSGNYPKSNTELDKKFRIPKINYQVETPKIHQTIAECNILSTNLTNTLHSLEPQELSIHSAKANDEFDKCRAIRRKVLRYLQLVSKEELLGALLKSNDDLVTALQLYEKFSTSRNGGADSDDDSLANYETDESSSSYEESFDQSSYAASDISEPEPRRAPPPLASASDMLKGKRSPPPVPPKSPQLRFPKATTANVDAVIQNHKPITKQGTTEDKEYNPFDDDNEVANPTVWR